ncbi:hypothetical protein LWI28_026170 [Acer negundo]|uniref:Uncharacterized protein n=1 Tax=Acer negundo TaxID=4023 RepID=A0AAD5JY24_ACENE|nr:hypothetical protein LWI28_026170 [Acer negundo]
MKERFEALGMNVIVRMIAGKRYLGTDEEESSRFQKAPWVISFLLVGLVLVIQRRLNRNINEEEQDFIHVMLSAMDDGKISAQDANTVIKANCLSLNLGGNIPQWSSMGTLSAIKQPPCTEESVG